MPAAAAVKPLPSTVFEESFVRDAPRGARRSAPGLWSRLAARLGAGSLPAAAGDGGRGGLHSPSQASTLPPPSRGQALREAHRTLRERMRAHPSVRQVLPHLAAVEKSLGKRGSRALLRLPVPVLQRGLEQLAVLQQDDESDADAQNLRVLRLRLIEAISMRSGRGRLPGLAGASDSATPMESDLGAVSPLSDLRIPAGLACDMSAAEFDEAERAWARFQARQRAESRAAAASAADMGHSHADGPGAAAGQVTAAPVLLRRPH